MCAAMPRMNMSVSTVAPFEHPVICDVTFTGFVDAVMTNPFEPISIAVWPQRTWL